MLTVGRGAVFLVLVRLAGAVRLPSRQLAGDVSTRAPNASIPPAYWLHIPKAGSSFQTSIVQTTCSGSVPENLTAKHPQYFFRDWGSECPPEKFLRFMDGHAPLEQGRPELLSHVVTMMREPVQRIISGYFAFPEERLHDCPELRAKYGCEERGTRCAGDIEGWNGWLITNPSVIPPTEYAECVKNCAANMLTGAPCGSAAPPNASLAVATLKELGFVGLTGEWELSVCLWHAKFGGQPLPAELANVRPGVVPSHDGYDAEVLLGGWRADAEAVVYQAAKELFQADLLRHSLTAEVCAEWLVRSGAKAVPKGTKTSTVIPSAVYDED